MKMLEAIQVFIANRQLRGAAVSTIKQYQQQLSRMLEFSDKLPTKPEQIEAVLSTIPGGQATKHCYFSTYRTFYNFLEKRCGVKNPMRCVDAPKVWKAKVMPTLEMSDIELLPIFIKNDRDRALISLLLDTGIRSGEAVSLRKEDIKENYIKVKGKVGERIIPISASVVKLLLELPSSDGYVFHGERGRLTRNGVYEVVRKYLTRIGITGEKLGGHRLRHTFGRQYLVLGGDLRSLQMIMGHTNIQTTAKYANLAIEDLIQKHHQFTPVQLMEVK